MRTGGAPKPGPPLASSARVLEGRCLQADPQGQPPSHCSPPVPSQLFSSCSESFRSFGSSLLLLFALVRGSATLRPSPPEPSGWYGLFCASYVVLELWVVLRLFAAVLLHRYREMHFELYRPAFEPQDYEMVELFVRRLKMWMGFSKAKEVSAARPGSPSPCGHGARAHGVFWEGLGQARRWPAPLCGVAQPGI